MGWGTHVNPWLIHVNVWQKPLQYCKVISLQLIKINWGKKRERFYEDLQDLLELTPKKDFLFIIGDWNAKVGSQETPGVTDKYGLGVWNEAGKG